MKRIVDIAALIILLALSGCASVITGNSQTITISSTPSGARVSIRDKYQREVFSGFTPTSVTLKKGARYFVGQDYVIEISKEGFNTRLINVTSGIGGWYLLGNLVFGAFGAIGWLIIDPFSGAMWVLSPEQVIADFDEPVNGNKLQVSDKSNETLSLIDRYSPAALHIVLLENVSSTLRQIMRRIN